ncbi:MAG: hypothetical protein NZL89_05745 [Leptospiraceae bacterium]|nr:hypothetical protein [Leptospiraceae bacterium]
MAQATLRLFLLFSGSLVPLLFWECSAQVHHKKTQLRTGQAAIGLSLHVGKGHTDAFGIQEYSVEGIEGLFANLEEQSQKYCKANNSYHPKLKYNWIVASLMNGCLNFYLMNDLNVHRVFAYVGAALAGQKNDCYTVGFSQLYLMSVFMPCDRIAVIDINYKMLKSHFMIISHVYENGDYENILRQIDTAPRKNKGIASFCKQEDVKVCAAAFSEFPQSLRHMKNIDFQLAFLHEIRFLETDAQNIVIYTSNALDYEYTKPEEFQHFMRAIYSAIGTDKTAYVIYHTGGDRWAAVYQLRNDGLKTVTVVCRDELAWAPSYGQLSGVKYATYLDQSSYTKAVTHNSAEYNYASKKFRFPKCRD